jgi:type III restriction enzyme
MAQVLESMDEVVCYVKNQGLGFFIPYTYAGQQRNYQPDFIVRVNDGRKDLLNLIVEVSGEARADKAAKVSTARELWLPAINGHGDFGRWEFINITDPWDAENTIKGAIASGKFDRVGGWL